MKAEELDPEIRKLIESMASKIIEDVKKDRIFDQVGSDSPHGIYVYDKVIRKWILLKSDGEWFEPKENGSYVIYFDNARCSACRKYDPHWFKYVNKYADILKGMKFLIILCNWFSRECKSTAASASFKFYDVHSSPTTMLIYVKDEKIAYKEKYEGYLTFEELEKVINTFEERANKAMAGLPVEKPIKRTDEEDIIKLLKLLLSKADLKKG
jgi:hypothetical protein